MKTIKAVKGFVGVFGSIVHQSTEVSYEAVMSLFPLTDEQEVDMSSFLDILGKMEWVDLLLSVIAKNVDADVVLTLNSLDILDRCWELNSFHVEFILILSILLHSISVVLIAHRM